MGAVESHVVTWGYAPEKGLFPSSQGELSHFYRMDLLPREHTAKLQDVRMPGNDENKERCACMSNISKPVAWSACHCHLP